MDKIIISDLEVYYHVGVTDAEREKAQRLLISVQIEHDFKKAAASDSIADTIDYFAICQRLLHLGNGRQWKLIESLASEIADTILKEHKAKTVAVEVKKFIIPQAKYVAVSLMRGSVK
jgi:FolB domain-containing protein